MDFHLRRTHIPAELRAQPANRSAQGRKTILHLTRHLSQERMPLLTLSLTSAKRSSHWMWECGPGSKETTNMGFTSRTRRRLRWLCGKKSLEAHWSLDATMFAA